MESQCLILGQYLARVYSRIRALDLHTALMRFVLSENLRPLMPAIRFSELVNKVVGAPTDISKYEQNAKYTQEWQALFLNSLYFLIFHEFCHIHAKDPQKRIDINKLRDGELPKGTTKTELLFKLEAGADSCALDIIDREESQYKSSPVSFLAPFVVISTQAVLEKVVPEHGTQTHPSSAKRLFDAYQIGLRSIVGSAQAEQYKATLSAVYSHFAQLLSN
jgi:hypothetical protein